MEVSYRNIARKHLKCAEDELNSDSDLRLKYAALDLRMAMEALTYDRALAYKDEFPPNEYETWQPRRVMSVLLDIDPMADKNCSLAVGAEQEYGVRPRKMTSLGSETVLSMEVLKKHYDALGSYLHVQSMKQARSGASLDYRRFRARCKEISAFVDQVLSSRVFNVTLGSFAKMKCMKCGNPIRKRMPHGQQEVQAECYECKATYTVSDEGDGKVLWTPHQHELKCANPDCQGKIIVWSQELEPGANWECKACKGNNRLVLTIQYEKAPNKSLQESPENGAPE
jgi:hypothetical protein